MKITLFSDLHAHPFHQYARVLSNGLNGRLQDAFDAVATVRAATGASGAQAVLFGGDLFHTMSRLDVGALGGVFAEIAAFAPTPVFLLVGNHDQADKTGTRHALEVFKALPHVVVMEAPGWFTHPGAPGLAVYGVPYREDTNEVRALLAGISAPPAHTHRVLLLHVGFDGARTGPHEYRMASELSVADVPEGFDFVLSGHYHTPQWMDQARRIAYIGATTHQSWGDANQNRGFAIADLEHRTLERLETRAPRFLRLTKEHLDQARPGDFVELILPADADDTEVLAARVALDAREVGGGQIVRAAAPEEPAPPRLECAGGMDLPALIAPYVEHLEPDDLDRERLVGLGRELLQAAAAT